MAQVASATPTYGLAEVGGGDLIEPDHHNRVAESLDSVVGGFLFGLIGMGAASGWEIGGDKSVGAGSGLVDACWCRTAAPQAIGNLSNGAVNHVFACATSASAPHGEVSFVAQSALPGPERSVYLGTVTLDGEGAVTDVNNEAPGTQRQCHSLRWGRASRTGVVEGVAAGDSVRVTVDHGAEADFRLPGALSVECLTEGFSAEVWEHCRGDRFVVVLTNQGMDQADGSYRWEREGLLR